jgi:4-amino-4-deoxy-L-arabinose transferase-like glycosyltransferase
VALPARSNLLVILLAATVCALVNPGNFGTIDTARRWQSARWIRLGEPAVTAEDARSGFGLPGRNGALHPWYGVGQSLVILPLDALVDATVAPALRRAGFDPVRQRQGAELTIAFLMQFVLTACVLLLARRVVFSFGFGSVAATAGALSLLFATTCLAYVQCAQENLLLLALALAALAAVRRWQEEARGVWAMLAGAACGFAMLVRLPSALEAAAFAAFALTAGTKRVRFLAWFAPPVLAALLVDRWYHWIRFGEVFSTYIGIFGRVGRPPGQPASFPFSYPFLDGFLGTFFSPDKSVLLFDPLLIVTAVLAAWRWRRMDRDLRRLLVCLLALLVAYAATYARYFNFGGDTAWGHRFAVLPAQLLCLFAAPLLLARGRSALWALAVAAVALQVGSTVISPNAEIAQREMGDRHGVLWNRAVNLAQIAVHREDPQRFRGIPVEWRTVAYLPFQLRAQFPRLAAWAMAVWTGLLLLLPVLTGALWREARREDAHGGARA